ncbi:MAG TPA: imidazoleglycerol-phosphate dehydratase HisB [Alphaproteobacteria bacterium]
MRQAKIKRKTAETNVRLKLSIDGNGRADIDTGIGFFDHMLGQLAFHSGMDLKIRAKGDLHIDAHHTVEDVGLSLGKAFKKALDNKKGIARYGYAYAPMDEALTRVAIDISNRPHLSFQVPFNNARLGKQMETELFAEFFKSFAQKAGISLHIDTLRGGNDHHKVESAFKATALALRMATAKTGRKSLPSTKNAL